MFTYKSKFDKLKLKESILKNKKDLENIRNYIDRNEENINKFQLYYNGATSLNINKIMNNLDKLDRFIKKSCSEFVLINDLLAPITLEAMYRRDLSVYSEDSDKDKGRKIAKKYKILYSNIKNGIDLAVPLFENAANGLD
jgi:hypothetical protein